MKKKVALVAVLATLIASPASASSKFALEYRVERVDAQRLSLATCMATAQKASAALGYVPASRQMYPGQLAVMASGPRNGGGSMTVYCIAVDRKTTFVVQVLDYLRQQSPAAKNAADKVQRALLQARG